MLIYQRFNDAIEVYNDFIQKTMVSIGKVAAIRERIIKHNSHKLFDSEVLEVIRNFALHIDMAPYRVHNLIFNEKWLVEKIKLLHW